nr:early nodulin-like protein 3 [Ipomoea trifida]
MAGFSSSSYSVAVLLLFFLFISFTEARDHLVGGKSDAWKIPSSPSDSLNNWAEKTRFLPGDSLVWKYDGKTDAVLEVSKRDYVTCNTSMPIGAHNDGDTKIVLERSGPYYFISGAEGHCQKGQKLIVVVMSEKHTRKFLEAAAPSPADEVEAPAVAPTSGAVGLKGSLGVGLGLMVGLLFLM